MSRQLRAQTSPSRIINLQACPRRETDLLQQASTSASNILDELFASDSSSGVDSGISYEEPAPKKGPGVPSNQVFNWGIQPWIHEYLPLFDSTLDGQAEFDPASSHLMCSFGKHGHNRAGRQLCKGFRFIDEGHIQQAQSALFHYQLANFTECTMAESHPPIMRRQSLFSALRRSPDPISIEEFYFDLAFVNADRGDRPRLNLEGLSDHWGKPTGVTKFGQYVTQLVSGKNT